MDDSRGDAEYDEGVGRNVRELREARGLTQVELAEKLTQRGLHFRQQTVVKVEQGVRPLRLREADAIADVLEIDVDALVPMPEYPDITALVIELAESIENLYIRVVEQSTTMLWNQRLLRAILPPKKGPASSQTRGLPKRVREQGEAAVELFTLEAAVEFARANHAADVERDKNATPSRTVGGDVWQATE